MMNLIPQIILGCDRLSIFKDRFEMIQPLLRDFRKV